MRRNLHGRGGWDPRLDWVLWEVEILAWHETGGDGAE
ncbi:hypothetical protein Rrhod_4163 [Rhodococcus rhodnii LMG 5362]|uniref:Uncharacterized protein n=1 Tax=Rhodococcus rhodnii LMG 5362 TaxID=1273125 RepID=R7WH75_9NOCA|nr:hypothetical protein Rrhod_4163 [Rhodococcus rhodnii LMG 5362]